MCAMNNLTQDVIAIDANVLRHLTNPQNNVDGHIDALLRRLLQDGIRTLVDDQNKIVRECEYQIIRRTKNMDEGRAERVLLVNWLSVDNRETVTVDMDDALMLDITEIIPEKEDPDRFYVYVAFKRGRILVTNDGENILGQRDLLANICPQDAGILDSQEAHDGL